MSIKKYLDRVKNGDKLAINTPTQADYDKLMKELDKTEVKWYVLGDKPSMYNRSHVMKQETYIIVDKNLHMYYTLSIEGYTVIHLSDLGIK